MCIRKTQRGDHLIKLLQQRHRIAQHQAENPLPKHRPDRVPATGPVVWIVQNPHRLLGQSQHPIRLPQQHRVPLEVIAPPAKLASTLRPLQRVHSHPEVSLNGAG